MYRIIYTLVFWLRKPIRSQAGATAIEYGLIVGLMAAVLVSIIGIFGERIDDLFEAIATKLGEATDIVKENPEP
ncbi:MAG: Flp family type IVb pilin [Desulfobacteraceae bacterium]|jgi:pilus assembly protein Flp/PilA